MSRFPIALLLFLVVTAGCGGRGGKISEPVASIEVQAPMPDLPVAGDTCVAASADYYLVLLAGDETPAPFCEELERHIPGSVAPSDEPWPAWDDAEDLYCVVSRLGVQVLVMTIPPAYPQSVDAYSACSSMVRAGWKLRPVSEHFPSAFAARFPGSCFVGRQPDVQLVARTLRGTGYCDAFARRYLTTEQFRVSTPVGESPTFGWVCEAARGPDRIRLLGTSAARGRIDVAAICEAMAAEGWVVTQRTIG